MKKLLCALLLVLFVGVLSCKRETPPVVVPPPPPPIEKPTTE